MAYNSKETFNQATREVRSIIKDKQEIQNLKEKAKGMQGKEKAEAVQKMIQLSNDFKEKFEGKTKTLKNLMQSNAAKMEDILINTSEALGYAPSDVFGVINAKNPPTPRQFAMLARVILVSHEVGQAKVSNEEEIKQQAQHQVALIDNAYKDILSKFS